MFNHEATYGLHQVSNIGMSTTFSHLAHMLQSRYRINDKQNYNMATNQLKSKLSLK